MNSVILQLLILFGTCEAKFSPAQTLTATRETSSPVNSSNLTTPPSSAKTSLTSLAPLPTQSGPSSPLPTQENASLLKPKLANLTTPDDGSSFGNAVIYNWCSYDVYFMSVGAHYLGGYRNGAEVGWGTPEDEIRHSIPSKGGKYIESFRASGGCKYTGAPIYCPDEDKLAGQAISIKISKSNDTADQDITQLEYALYRNPATTDTFKRLYYDVSLLDCGAPEGMVTDLDATADMVAKKRDSCPGYDGGVAVTFSGDEKGDICPPIYCDGKSKCFMIYTFDRTRPQESSFTCEKEYRGDLRLDLCAENGDAVVQQAAKRFSSWAQTATHEVLKLEMNKTLSLAGSPTSSVAQLHVTEVSILQPTPLSKAT